MRVDHLLDRLTGRPRTRSRKDAAERLQRKYRALRELTSANTAALEILAELQRMATGEFVFDMTYLRRATDRALALGRQVVGCLDVLTERPQARLAGVVARIAREIESILNEQPRIPAGPLTLDLASAARAPVDLIGAKTRRLAEMREIVGIPVPDGFVVTSAACHRMLAQNGVSSSIERAVAELTLVDREALARATGAISEQLRVCTWPVEVADAILDAYDELARRSGGAVRVSVRSSAAGEDGEVSFAGQYVSVLNVDRAGLLQACTHVLASQFGARAVVYYKAKGFVTPLPMAIGVIAMVEARASGVLYTRPPDRADADTMVVTGTWGLGPTTVDGSVTPDVFTISRGQPPEILEARVAGKDRMLVGRETGGVVEVTVPAWMRKPPCLTVYQLRDLAACGTRLEQHYGTPLDIEWAVNADETVVVLQSRRLRTRLLQPSGASVLATRKGLSAIAAGVVVSHGVGTGPVVLATPGDARDIPQGSVIVARAATPDLAAVIDRAAAIVTEVGSVASHLATVAREFHVPAIFDAREALTALKAGQVVTVDAEMGNVYAGRIEALLGGRAHTRDDDLLGSPLFRKLRAIAGLLTPLNLADPRGLGFRAARCRTLHDVLRYAHEVGVQEMFLAGGAAARIQGAAKVDDALPLDFHIVDLGGGLADGGAIVTPDRFRSRPLAALWRGLRGVEWSTAPAATAQGLASVMMTTLASTDAARRPEPSYVLVTDTYMNIAFRFGYHFARVDAHLGADPGENYATILFHGGAANTSGRLHRLDFIGAVLTGRHWQVERRHDALVARIEALPDVAMAEELEHLGRLLVVTRQMDTMLGDAGAARRAAAAFQSGDTTLDVLKRNGPRE